MINFTSKKMKQLNLNNIAAALAILSLSVFSVRQCSDKVTYRKQFEEQLSENIKLKSDMKGLKASHNDSILAYQSKLSSLRKEKESSTSSYKAYIKTLHSKIDKLSIEESKAFIDSVYVPTGEEVVITGGQVKDIHVAELKRLKCEEQIEVYDNFIFELDKAYGNSIKESKRLNGELSVCEASIKEKDVKIKTLKRKVRGRTLFGGASAALLILVLL